MFLGVGQAYLADLFLTLGGPREVSMLFAADELSFLELKRYRLFGQLFNFLAQSLARNHVINQKPHAFLYKMY